MIKFGTIFKANKTFRRWRLSEYVNVICVVHEIIDNEHYCLDVLKRSKSDVAERLERYDFAWSLYLRIPKLMMQDPGNIKLPQDQVHNMVSTIDALRQLIISMKYPKPDSQYQPHHAWSPSVPTTSWSQYTKDIMVLSSNYIMVTFGWIIYVMDSVIVTLPRSFDN